jgi:hypothetical protein
MVIINPGPVNKNLTYIGPNSIYISISEFYINLTGFEFCIKVNAFEISVFDIGHFQIKIVPTRLIVFLIDFRY